ncbi:MAG: hypothetical protein AAF969_17800, partial [Bacteroidota bacterium]
MINIILGLIVVIIIVAFAMKSSSLKKNKEAKTDQLQQNPYYDLRNMAFQATPEQLGIEPKPNSVYGIIMDWDLGNGIMTLISYQTGDASMYLSTGGGVIGGGQHESVISVVKTYLELGNSLLMSANHVEHSKLPESNTVNFYFLTEGGKLLRTENMVNFENGSSELYGLFNEANNVITQLRMISDMK